MLVNTNIKNSNFMLIDFMLMFILLNININTFYIIIVHVN